MTDQRRVPVRPVRCELICSECGGQMKRNNMPVLTSNPPQYPHECENCGRISRHFNSFPFIAYEDIE